MSLMRAHRKNALPASARGVIVFPLGIQDLAERSALGQAAHFQVEAHILVIFRQHINSLAFFGCLYKCYPFCHSAVGEAFA